MLLRGIDRRRGRGGRGIGRKGFLCAIAAVIAVEVGGEVERVDGRGEMKRRVRDRWMMSM